MRSFNRFMALTGFVKLSSGDSVGIMVWYPERLQAAVTICQTEKERKRKKR